MVEKLITLYMKVNVSAPIGVMSDNAHNERIYYNREGMIITIVKKQNTLYGN